MESVLIPHGNQTKSLRTMQDELCRALALAPALPLAIRGVGTPKAGERFASLAADALAEEGGTVFLKVRAEFAPDGKLGEVIRTENGRIDIGRRLASLPRNDAPLPAVRETAFPVVQSAEIGRTRDGPAEEWTIRRGKWWKAG